MYSAILAQVVPFDRPTIDWHAVAPELILLGFGALLTTMDAVFLEKGRKSVSYTHLTLPTTPYV